MLGFVLSIAGTLTAIAGATFALTSGFVDFKKVNQAQPTRWFCTHQFLKYFLVSSRPDIVADAGYADVADWWSKFTASDTETRERAKHRLDVLMPLLTYLAVRRRLKLGILVIFVGVAVTAAGTTMFAWNISRPVAAQPTAAAGQPLAVVVRLSAEGRAILRGGRGRQCAPDHLDGLLLANGSQSDDVLIEASGRCPSFRLALTPLLGTVEVKGPS